MSDVPTGQGCLPCKPTEPAAQDAGAKRVEYTAVDKSKNAPDAPEKAVEEAGKDTVASDGPEKGAAEEAKAPEEAKTPEEAKDSEEAKPDEPTIEERVEKLAADESVDTAKLWSKFLDVKMSVEQETVSDVLVTFKTILKRCKAPADKLPLYSIPEGLDVKFKDGKYIHNPKQSKILQRMKTYEGETPMKGLKVVIVGAGPAGLRLAVEMAFNGAEVHVVENRPYFDRRNTLYVWKFSQLDLISLGLKTLWPQFACGELRLINIGLLQHSLLRAALVLGVKVWPGTKYLGVGEDGSILTDGQTFTDVSVLVDSSGNKGIVRSTLWKGKPIINADKRLKVSREAIALTFNTPRFPKKDKQVPQFTMTASVDRQVLTSKKIKLENIVYFRSPLSNYVVCTLLKRTALKKFGVCKENFKNASKLLARSNVDNDALKKLCVAIAKEWNVPLGPEPKELLTTRRGDHDCMLFRFDNLLQSEEPITQLETTKGKLIVAVVGDAAASPFWPRGTGANHSILFCLCIAGALRAYNTSKDAEEERFKNMKQNLVKSFDSLFNGASDPNKIDFGMGIRHPEGHY